MNFHYPHLARLATRTVSSALLTVVTLMMLVLVWSSFFLWGVRFTEEVITQIGIIPISPVLLQVGTWQLKIDGLGESAITPYLPALALLLISQAFYFYRIPRTHRRFTVTWEFVATTFLFILTHLCLWSLVELLSLWRIVISGPLNLVITLLMLCGLFWLQWVGLVATADVD